ncbi:hypothetical protein RclHR1_09420001 [Rhizophagus clarus]|nr:hypothetical protein RclHR1_09420001 [Rhizophagus clarus]
MQDTENTNEWINWIEEAVAKKHLEYYKYNQFINVQEIGAGTFGKVYRAIWKNLGKFIALKSFFNLNNVTLKEIICELEIQREVDYHDNIIRCYGITIYKSENLHTSNNYMLVMEYADSGSLRNYLKKNFNKLTWNDKYNMAYQLACAVSYLHSEGIAHRDLHSENVLVHQNVIKLKDFGLSKRIEEGESSNLRSKLFRMVPYVDPESFSARIYNNNQMYLLNEKSDVYSVGVLLWELSSGQPPFHVEEYDVGLALEILQGLRETVVPDTPKNYVTIYTKCWDGEPDNRPNMHQVVDWLKAIITKSDVIQSSDKQESLRNNLELQGDLSQLIQNYDKVNTEEIDTIKNIKNSVIEKNNVSTSIAIAVNNPTLYISSYKDDSASLIRYINLDYTSDTTTIYSTSNFGLVSLLQNPTKSTNYEQNKQLNYGLFLSKHKIIPSEQALSIENGKWDISLYEGQPLVYTNINGSSDICIDFSIIEITYKEDLKLKYFQINSEEDEFFTKKISVGDKLFIKESSLITQTQIDILKFYLFCAYNLTKYSIEVQSNNLFTLNLLLRMETMDGKEINTHEKLTEWMNNLCLQKTLDEKKPNYHEELIRQMKIIDIISYSNVASKPQSEYKKLDDIESDDQRQLGINNFEERLYLEDWIGNAAYDNLICWTMDFHLFHGLITNQNYEMEISKKIAIDFIKIPKVNISDKFYLKMIRPSTKLEVSLVSSNILSVENLNSFPFVKYDIKNYEGFSHILVKCERYEILLDEDDVKPTREFEKAIEKSFNSMEPLKDLQRLFDEYGHLFSRRIILGRSLKIILPTSSLNHHTFENINNVNEILKSLDKLGISYLITQKGKNIERNNLSSWFDSANDNLEIIEYDKIIPFYKIFNEKQKKVDDILDKFNDQNSRIIMTGITDLKDLEYLKDDLKGDVVNVFHYKRINIKTSLKDENYEVYGSVISENNERLEEIYVNFGLCDFNGFYAIIKKAERMNFDITKCYISWIIIGIPSQLSVFSPNNRELQVDCIKKSIKSQPANEFNHNIVNTSFNLHEGYTVFAHAYHSSTNEPKNIIKLVKWSHNSINFQISRHNLNDTIKINDETYKDHNSADTLNLRVCIPLTSYNNLKIDNNKENERILIGYILTKENFDESLGQTS